MYSYSQLCAMDLLSLREAAREISNSLKTLDHFLLTHAGCDMTCLVEYRGALLRQRMAIAMAEDQLGHPGWRAS